MPNLKGTKAPAKPLVATDPADMPDVERHDEVFFRHTSGPKVGRVLSRGAHGATVEADGKRHPMPWADFLGHKTRVRKDVQVISQGEDGILTEASTGERRFIRDPLSPGVDKPLAKSFAPTVLMFMGQEDLAKAIKNAPGLSLQKKADKNGRQSGHWVRTNKEQPKGRPVATPVPQSAAAGSPTVQGQLPAGQSVSFKIGSLSGEGVIVGSPGVDGAHVKDASGHEHQVPWENVKKSASVAEKPAASTPSSSGGGKGGAAASADDSGGEKPGEFSAADYGKSTDDPNASVESVLKDFPPTTAALIEAADAKLASVQQTAHSEKTDGQYNAERQDLHRKILYEGIEKDGKRIPGIMTPEKVAAATPAPGEKPTFTILGGRGGSGKSWFEGKVFDKNKAIVLDADAIKGMLPEYAGWNAHQVHEESGELFDSVTDLARVLGLNVVHDATMKTGAKSVSIVNSFKQAGYRVEAHYMHLPRQVAAKRAIGRFLTKKGDGSGRYVPPSVVLGNTSNEQSFDSVKPMADKWSFRDNNVQQGAEPKLVAEGGSDKSSDTH